MNFYCIADENTVRGFRLAGVSGQVVNTAPEAAAALETAAARRDCAVIILTENGGGKHPGAGGTDAF